MLRNSRLFSYSSETLFLRFGKIPEGRGFFLFPKGQSQSMSQMPLGFWGKDDIVANLILRLQMVPRADSNCP